jgi:rhamnosyltransferase
MTEYHNIPKVAILLATYNGDRWISEQISSILNQTNVDLKVFVSDDLSTDATLSIVNELALSDTRVTILPKGKKFGSAGKNFYRLIEDVDFSEFDYVALADQDDLWFKDKLSIGIKQLKANHAEGYSSDVIAFWEDGKKLYVKKSYPQKSFDYLFESAGPGCTFILSKKLAKKVKLQLKKNKNQERSFFHHDWLIYAIARSVGMRWVIGNTPGMMYRQHGGNETGVNSGFSAILARIEKLRAGWYLNQVYHLAKIVKKADLLVCIIGKARHIPLKFPFYFMSSRRRLRDCIVLLILMILRIAK